MPVRTVRCGPIWDEAKEVADDNGDILSEIIRDALTRYVARKGKKK